MTSNSSLVPLSRRDLGDYGFARARDLAFDAVHGLWRRRQAAGMRQTDLAVTLGRDEGWISRNLNGPGNWTLRTLGELIIGLNGELEILAFAVEDSPPNPSNYDAYAEYFDVQTATANMDFRRNWNTGTWAPDLVLQGGEDHGIVTFVELKKR